MLNVVQQAPSLLLGAEGPFCPEAVKRIEAIIRPFKLEHVRRALCDSGVEGMTIEEVRGFGRQRGQTETYGGNEYTIDFMPKVKLEVIVPDQFAARAVNLITRAAQTGKLGDGKIFVSTVERAVRIRTDEKNEKAI